MSVFEFKFNNISCQKCTFKAESQSIYYKHRYRSKQDN